MCSSWWVVINVGQVEIYVRGWNFFCMFFLTVRRQVSPWLSLIFGSVGSVWWGLKYFNFQIQNDRERESHPCVNLRHENNISFCRNLWNWCLFLAHPTWWHKSVSPENAQTSSCCWLGAFEVSCKIRVLTQSESVMLCCVSHTTILPVSTCVMNVRDQRGNLLSLAVVHFVTAWASDSMSKFVHRP